MVDNYFMIVLKSGLVNSKGVSLCQQPGRSTIWARQQRPLSSNRLRCLGQSRALVDIEAESPDGFDKDKQRTRLENANTLGFDEKFMEVKTFGFQIEPFGNSALHRPPGQPSLGSARGGPDRRTWRRSGHGCGPGRPEVTRSSMARASRNLTPSCSSCCMARRQRRPATRHCRRRWRMLHPVIDLPLLVRGQGQRWPAAVIRHRIILFGPVLVTREDMRRRVQRRLDQQPRDRGALPARQLACFLPFKVGVGDGAPARSAPEGGISAGGVLRRSSPPPQCRGRQGLALLMQLRLFRQYQDTHHLGQGEVRVADRPQQRMQRGRDIFDELIEMPLLAFIHHQRMIAVEQIFGRFGSPVRRGCFLGIRWRAVQRAGHDITRDIHAGAAGILLTCAHSRSETISDRAFDLPEVLLVMPGLPQHIGKLQLALHPRLGCC